MKEHTCVFVCRGFRFTIPAAYIHGVETNEEALINALADGAEVIREKF